MGNAPPWATVEIIPRLIAILRPVIGQNAIVWTFPDAAGARFLKRGEKNIVIALAISMGRVVGVGGKRDFGHAFFWPNIDALPQDIHPDFAKKYYQCSSEADQIRGNSILGSVAYNKKEEEADHTAHACIWHIQGNRVVSVIDLSRFVPARYRHDFPDSSAADIDNKGRVYGEITGVTCGLVVMWVPVPEGKTAAKSK